MSHDHDHDHSHDHGLFHAHDHGPTPEKALWVAIILNAAFLVLEAGVGWWTNSLALLSDAGHMLSDVGALIIALIAVRIATRKPKGYTFGLRRAPVLGGLLNAASLVVIVVFIGVEAVARFEDPPDLDATAVLWTGVAGLLVNLGSAWYLARSRDTSVNTRGAMLHLLSDALGSVAAIASALAVWLWDFPLADPIASIIIGLLILLGSWPLLRDTLRILLQRAPNNIDVDAVRSLIEDHPRVVALTDLHLWAIDSGQPVLSAMITIEGDGLKDGNAVADELRGELKARFEIAHATLECRHVEMGVVVEGC